MMAAQIRAQGPGTLATATGSSSERRTRTINVSHLGAKDQTAIKIICLLAAGKLDTHWIVSTRADQESDVWLVDADRNGNGSVPGSGVSVGVASSPAESTNAFARTIAKPIRSQELISLLEGLKQLRATAVPEARTRVGYEKEERIEQRRVQRNSGRLLSKLKSVLRLKQPPAKVVLIGPPGAGKTTFVEAVSDGPVARTDVHATDNVRGIKNNTTIAMDSGRWRNEKGEEVAVYGAPGQARLSFMLPVLLRGATHVVVCLHGESSNILADYTRLTRAALAACGPDVRLSALISHTEGLKRADLLLRRLKLWNTARNIDGEIRFLDCRVDGECRSFLETIVAKR